MDGARKICVVSSSRADYGIMSQLINLLNEEKGIDLHLVATGMHLSKKYGMTVNEIEIPCEKIDIDIEAKPIHSSSIAIEKFYNYFISQKPHIVVVLGDRYEMMAIVEGAMHANIPIAHLYGGDTTYGILDEAIRHSITKMSHLHFVSCENSRKRVIQLGENPDRVFNFGALGVENIKKIELMNKEELEKSLEIKFKEKNVIVTFHPMTLYGDTKQQFIELLLALETLENTNIIITCPNSDRGNEDIFELIKDFEKKHKNVNSFISMGLKRYLSSMQFVNMVIGNSSSGIYEVPSFKIPTINIGNRQKGRMQAKSIINCEPKRTEIIKAIEKAYMLDCSDVENPYEKENTAENIVKILKTYPLENILEKEFYNINFENV